MLCSSCGVDNPANARFCGHCGVAQTIANRDSTSGSDNSFSRPDSEHPTNPPEPFGFKVGMNKAQIIELIGSQSVLKDDGDSFELSTAPTPHEDFLVYTISVSLTAGLVQVMALSKDIGTNAYGDALKATFASLKDGLSNKYGNPTNLFDFLGEGSIWSEPREWMMGLAKKERTLSAYWKGGGGCQISLEAFASFEESGFLIIQYQYPDFAIWLREYEQKKNSSL